MSEELAMDSGALIFATLADVYLSSGMIDEAISILRDGLLRNPTYTLAKIILGRAYYMKGDMKEAIQILEGVYEEAKDSENLNLYLGHSYRKINQFDKALIYYEATLKVNPGNKEAKHELDTLKPQVVPVQVEKKVAVNQAPVTPTGKEAVREVQPELKPAELLRTPATPIALQSLDEPVNKLLAISMVKGAFISSKDGLIIHSYYPDRVDIEEICALIAEIYSDVNESFKILKEESLERCIIEKEDETICVIEVGDLLFTVVTQPEAKPGIVFVYARKIIEEMKEILG